MVLEFDFSGLDTANEERFTVSFSQKVQTTVYDFLNKYKDFFSENVFIKQIDVEQPGIYALYKAFNAATSAGKKIFVIVDNYDHFAEDLIVNGTNDVYQYFTFSDNPAYVLYEILKEGTGTVVDKIMLTGNTPLMLEGNGFNIYSNLSLKSVYNEMLGFTKDEVNMLMKETGVEQSMVNVDMKQLYNGYLFHENGEHRIYNPSMIFYLFDNILNGKNVENIIDENFMTGYEWVQHFVQNDRSRGELAQIAKNNSIDSGIISRFLLNRLCKNESFVSLLFYYGLLTVDEVEEGFLRLKIPNDFACTVYKKIAKNYG
jgi:hypothetical protein